MNNDSNLIKKPKKLITWINLAILATGLAFIVFVIIMVMFFKHSHLDFVFTVNTDYIANYGSFLSGLIGTITSFVAIIFVYKTYESQKEEAALTRNLVDKQIALSVTPDIVVADATIHGYLRFNGAAGNRPLQVLSNEVLLREDLDRVFLFGLKNIYASIINIGFGSAKYVTCQWHYDVDKCLRVFRSQTGFIDAKFNPALNFPNNIMYHEAPDSGSVVIPDPSGVEIDYLTPTSQPNRGDADKGYNIPLPYPYLFLLMRSTTDKINHAYFDRNASLILINEYPPCKLSLKYVDMAGVTITKEFSLLTYLNNIKMAVATVRIGCDFTVKLKEIIPVQ